MESWRVVVLCIAFGLFICQTHGYPKSLGEVQEDHFIEPSFDDVVIKLPQGMVIKRSSEDLMESEPPVENLKKTLTVEDARSGTPVVENVEEKLNSEKQDMVNTDTSSTGAKSIVKFPEDSKQVMPSKDEEENIRAKKSTSMRGINLNNGPHTTTVCIQVRSDHQPQVMCGPQVNEGVEHKPSSPGARFAYQQEPAEQSYHRYGQQEPLPYPPRQYYIRASQQEPPSGRPFAASGLPNQQVMIPTGQQLPPKYVQESPSPTISKGSPAAARGAMFPMRRSEEELNNHKPIDGGYQSSGPPQPLRIIPQGPPPNSVVVHKQYYQAAPFQQGFASNLIAPSPLRLNCALHPEGGQYIQSFSPSLLRSVTPEYYTVGDQVITTQGDQTPRMAEGPQGMDGEGYYIDTQSRQGQGPIVGSPYAADYTYSSDPWSGTAYVGEDGQSYFMENSQSRAAMEDQRQQMWQQDQYLRAMGMSSSSKSMTMEELKIKSNQQEEELKQSKQRLHQLQQQLKDIEQRAVVKEEEKKDSKKDVHNHTENPDTPQPPAQHESTPEAQEPKKTEPPIKNAKRQTHRIK